ncbi:hypothetical protein Bca4012_069065 [Brassica carinata]
MIGGFSSSDIGLFNSFCFLFFDLSTADGGDGSYRLQSLMVLHSMVMEFLLQTIVTSKDSMKFYGMNSFPRKVSSAYPSLGQEDVDDEPLVNPDREFDTLDAISPASQDYNNYMLENVPPKYKQYIETCIGKMESVGKCGIDVLKEILTNEPVSRECCLMVVRAGKECHMEINKCSAEVESPSSSQDDTIKLS